MLPCVEAWVGGMCGVGGEVVSSEEGDLGDLVQSRPASRWGGRRLETGPAGVVREGWQVGWREAGQPIWTPVLGPCLPGWGSVGLCPVCPSVCLVHRPGAWGRPCCVAEAITLTGGVLSARPAFP